MILALRLSIASHHSSGTKIVAAETLNQPRWGNPQSGHLAAANEILIKPKQLP